MIYRTLGASGIEASAIGLGTWAVGGWLWGGTGQTEAVRSIEASIDEGVNLIDTAPAYGLGLSEKIVGKAIGGRRDKVVLATKCGLVWHTKLGEHFVDQDGKPVHRYLGAASIRYEVEESLRRLGTDYIDLYQTHWQDPTTPIEETMGALLDLKREGKIRAIGVSNAGITDIGEYRRVGPVDSDQEKYSMLDREPEQSRLPYLSRNGIAFLAYSPLAFGLLTGRVAADRQFPASDMRSTHPRFTSENRSRVNRMLQRMEPVANAHHASIAQVVLAWTMSQPGVTHVLAGARNAAHACTNAAAGRIQLAADELEFIAAILLG
jgi:aryl-alcohol dehydrogenase-like predicted oxidoreductase